jgi:protein O-mannosyl-transferase
MPNLRPLGAAAVALLLYARTVGFDFTYLDDDVLIRDDQAFLAQPSSIVLSFARTYFPRPGHDHAYYRPMVNASYGLDANLGGASPRIYHATNVVLHALATGLVFLLLARLGYRRNVALFGSLLFAVHPALTEAVAWIPGRNDSLLGLFALSAWLLFLRGLEPGRWASRLGHVLCFLGALFCKETAVVLPALWLGQAVFLDKRPWRTALSRWTLAGWILGFAAYLAARAAVVPDQLGAGVLGIKAAAANIVLLPQSLGKLVLPFQLSVLAVPEDVRIWPGIVAAGLVAALFFVRGVRRPMLWLGLACFVGFLLPGLPASTLLILENRLYLPLLGVVLFGCELAQALAWPSRRAVVAGGVVVLLLAVLAFHYSGSFGDRLTFSQAAVRASPHSSLAHRNLGVAYHVGGDENAAWREYEAALAEDQGEPVAHNNLAVILMAHGRLPEAEQHLRRELETNPRYIPAERNLALVLRAMKRVDEAALHWQRVLDLGSNDGEAVRELFAYYQTRDPAKAAELQRRLVR